MCSMVHAVMQVSIGVGNILFDKLGVGRFRKGKNRHILKNNPTRQQVSSAALSRVFLVDIPVILTSSEA